MTDTTTQALRLAREALKDCRASGRLDDSSWKRASRAIDAIDALPAGEAAAPAVQAEPVRDERATWWSVVMGAAASLEDAAACLHDPDAKHAAEGAAKYCRDRANALWTDTAPTAQPAAQAPRALTDALRMIAWSNDSAWQAQCAREALAAHGITAPTAPKE